MALTGALKSSEVSDVSPFLSGQSWSSLLCWSCVLQQCLKPAQLLYSNLLWSLTSVLFSLCSLDSAQDFTNEKQTIPTPRISVTPPLDECTEAMSMEGPPTKAATSGGAGQSQEPDSGANKEKP